MLSFCSFVMISLALFISLALSLMIAACSRRCRRFLSISSSNFLCQRGNGASQTPPLAALHEGLGTHHCLGQYATELSAHTQEYIEAWCNGSIVCRMNKSALH